MKAAVFHQTGGLEVLQIEEVPYPVPGPQDVIVKVRACGVNHLDLHSRRGRTRVAPMPHICGSEIAGEIDALGDAVSGLSVGQRVAVAPYLFCGRCEYCRSGEEVLCLNGDIIGLASQGGFAEYVRVPASSVIPLQEGLDFVSAAAVTLSTITAWHMLTVRAPLLPGQDVLVQAAGSGVGSAAIQIAKLCGARVIATAGSDEKLERARALGADEVINYRTTDLVQEVRRLTNKRGVDVVVDHIGKDTWGQSIACLARKGRLVTCGSTSGDVAETNVWLLFIKEIALIGSYGGTRHDLAEVLKLVARGQLKPVVHGTYPLSAIAEAQRLMEERQQFGKLIILPND
ncbi:MAG: zinc-binding dehydrogenase [Thermogemmatispora sp.]|uniref:zinc-binding dehydrogenase n=1 Tax=Thermogemmatispora sp. TaxID=1968838 RepID=UPI0019F092B8|nr:zinc-binding dehydrogenase [Thermogemmatispora sp.]MBE3566428.1 zinc-binding dehydrogenase [Thermogemmatispora sp.]